MKRKAIYGLFMKRQCFYVGSTGTPTLREYQHRRDPRFSKFKFTFRVLRWTTIKNAARIEGETIRRFWKLGQAQFNTYSARLGKSTSDICAKVARLLPGRTFSVATDAERRDALTAARSLNKRIVSRAVKTGSGFTIFALP